MFFYPYIFFYAAGGGGIMGKLRRWNITNNSEDCEPDHDSAATGASAQNNNKNSHLNNKSTNAASIGALKENYLFSELTDGDLEQMIGAMTRVTKQSGDIIIRQGHKGTEFFVLEKGHADVSIFGSYRYVYMYISYYIPLSLFPSLSLISPPTNQKTKNKNRSL